MASNINETNQVEEQPATYNRNFQLLLIGGLVFVVVVMVYASLFRSGRGRRPDRRAGAAARSGNRRYQTPTSTDRSSATGSKVRNSACRNKGCGTCPNKGIISTKRQTQYCITTNRCCRNCCAARNRLSNHGMRMKPFVVRQSRQADFNFEFFADAPETAPQDAPEPYRRVPAK